MADSEVSLYCYGHGQINRAWVSENCHFPECDKIVSDKSNQFSRAENTETDTIRSDKTIRRLRLES